MILIRIDLHWNHPEIDWILWLERPYLLDSIYLVHQLRHLYLSMVESSLILLKEKSLLLPVELLLQEKLLMLVLKL